MWNFLSNFSRLLENHLKTQANIKPINSSSAPSENISSCCAPYWNIANHGFAVGKFCQFSILGVHEASLGMLIGSWASCSSIFLFEN